MYIKIINRLMAIIFVASITACGGGGGGGSSSSSSDQDDSGSDSGSGTQETSSTGYFIDAAVSGVSYTTTTPSGSIIRGETGTNGEYQYYPGRNITFQVGDLTLGVNPGAALTTPYSFVDDDTHEDFPQNMAQLLLSVDSNQDASDGIQINNAVSSGFDGLAAGLLEMLDQASTEFESDFQGFVDSYLPDYSAHVVSAEDAQSHLNESMGSIDYQVSLPGSVWRSELQPIYIQAWNSEQERWVSYQACSSGDYDLYIVDDYSAQGVTTIAWDTFRWVPTCSREGEEVVQTIRDYDEQTLCGYKLYEDSEANVTSCSFADLNNKVTYLDNEGVTITRHISHTQDSNTIRQTIYKEYLDGEALLKEKWQVVMTRTSLE